MSGVVIVQNQDRPSLCLRMEKDASDDSTTVEDAVMVFISASELEDVIKVRLFAT